MSDDRRLYSDEEFVREARSDTESDDDRSSLDSASDSETEPASEDAPPTGHPQVVIPSSTHTPQPPEVSAVKPLVKSASAGPTLLNAPLDWADDSVADDHDRARSVGSLLAVDPYTANPCASSSPASPAA